MITYIQHKLRQFTYHYKTFPENPYFKVFDIMYQLDPSPWPNIIKLNEDDAYIHASFLAPESQTFYGREIAYFSAYKLSIFWLPGATHSGQGNGKQGNYPVRIEGASLKKAIIAHIDKNSQSTTITRAHYATKQDQAIQQLSGGFVIYKAIEVELKALIIHWLKHSKHVDQPSGATILASAAKLPSNEIATLIETYETTCS